VDFSITRMDVWAGELEDRPGALSSRLATIMMIGEADLDFVVVRPLNHKPGRGVLFIAPLEGPEQTKTAEDAGLRKSNSMFVVRLEGPDHPGLAAGVAGTLARADVNITGMTAAATKGNALIYLRFTTEREADAAIELLKTSLAEG